MTKKELKNAIRCFTEGKCIISIHEKYEEDFMLFLELNMIKRYWVDKNRCYLNYRTSTLPRFELRNSEVKKLRKMNKEEYLAKLEFEKQLLEKEINKLKEV